MQSNPIPGSFADKLQQAIQRRQQGAKQHENHPR